MTQQQIASTFGVQVGDVFSVPRLRRHKEIRGAPAVAVEQGMKATVQESRAKVVLAEVPKAIANAFRSGRIQ